MASQWGGSLAMSKREKFVLSIMAATVLMGGYLYFGPGASGSRSSVETLSDASAGDFVQQVIQQFRDDTTLARELFTIRSAERQWGKDPFVKSGVQLSDTAQQTVQDKAPAGAAGQLNMVYTGYIEVGAHRLAIINDMEYAPGDAIDDQGYYVRRIQPHLVEIGKLNAPDAIVLKLTEVETGMEK
jgi:hypothetical protein